MAKRLIRAASSLLVASALIAGTAGFAPAFAQSKDKLKDHETSPSGQYTPELNVIPGEAPGAKPGIPALSQADFERPGSACDMSNSSVSRPRYSAANDTGTQGADDVEPPFGVYRFAEGDKPPVLQVFLIFRTEDAAIYGDTEKKHQEG